MSWRRACAAHFVPLNRITYPFRNVSRLAALQLLSVANRLQHSVVTAFRVKPTKQVGCLGLDTAEPDRLVSAEWFGHRFAHTGAGECIHTSLSAKHGIDAQPARQSECALPELPHVYRLEADPQRPRI